MWKKILAVIASLLVIGGIVTGCVFWGKSCNAKADVKQNIYSQLKLVENGETYTGALPLGATVFSKTAFTTMSYAIDNGAKVTITGTQTGDAKDSKDYIAVYSGMKFISVAFISIDVSALEDTDHTLKVYVSGTVDGASVEYQIGKTVTFNVKNA